MVKTGKSEKNWDKVLTKGRSSGILTKLSLRRVSRRGREAGSGAKNGTDRMKTLKKALDKRDEVSYNSNVPPVRGVYLVN